MNLKELAGRVREAVKAPDVPEPADKSAADKPFGFDAPLPVDLDAMRAESAGVTRVETRPAATKEPVRESPPRPEVRRSEAVRVPELRAADEGTSRAVRWKAPATVPDLATIYKEAGIESPLHGYGVDKLTEMLSSPHLANAPREVRATAAQVALEAARVPLRDIIDDALLRAKALAAFEADKAFELQLLQMRAERRAQVLRDQVDAFRKQKNAEIEDLKRTIDASDQAFAQLRARKRREEERLHRIVTHFVEPRPATPPIAPRPGAPAATPSPATPSVAAPKPAETSAPKGVDAVAAAAAPAAPRPTDTQPLSTAPQAATAPAAAKPISPIGPATDKAASAAGSASTTAAASAKPAGQEER